MELFVIALIQFSLSAHYDGVYAGKYDFGIFENPSSLKGLLSKEKSLIAGLIGLRESLKREKSVLETVRLHLRLKGSSINKESLRDNPIAAYKLIQRNYQALKYYSEWKKESSKPNKEDFAGMESVLNKNYSIGNFEGGLRGMTFLIDAYKLKGEDLLNGRFPTAEGIVERVQIRDLILFAEEAYFTFSWFDTSISLLRSVLSSTGLTARPHLLEFARGIALEHNQFLTKRKTRVGKGFKVFPYMLNPRNLRKREHQPKFVENTDFFDRRLPTNIFEVSGREMRMKSRSFSDGEAERALSLITKGEYKEEEFRRICRGEVPSSNKNPEGKCVLLHHFDPFLRLGPVRAEIVSEVPLRMIFVDFLFEKEMEWLIEYSTPRLSMAVRNVSHDRGFGDSIPVHKTVQCWIEDVRYDNHPKVIILPGFRRNFHIQGEWPSIQSRQIVHEILFRLSKRLEIATRLDLSSPYSSTQYQVTRYGLGGLCETHLDPHGYLDGVRVPNDKTELYLNGDMLATVMGWLGDIKSEGGKTAFDFPGFEGILEPKRGSVAFWFSSVKSGGRDFRNSHGGCPVLCGSKWIFNKWIHYFNQWNVIPCGLKRKEEIFMYNGY